MVAKCLSGGEKRRLSIALELVANPTTFFLDEPTSGLDEVTAAQCIRLLKNLALQGKTVVCTIHQPSAVTFALFDQVFVLARGKCVFQGSPTMLVPFLSHANYTCPTHYSPSDYIIELCDSEDKDIIQTLSTLTRNGKLICSKPAITDDRNRNNAVAIEWRNAISTTATKDYLHKNPRGYALLETMKAFTKLLQSDYAVSSVTQFSVLFNVMMVKTLRNRTVLAIQLFHHVFCGIIFGLIFFRSANEGGRMFDHLKFCIGIIFFISYTQIIVPILACKCIHF